MQCDPTITDSQHAYLTKQGRTEILDYRFRLIARASYGKIIGVYFGKTVAALEEIAAPFRMTDSHASTTIDQIVQD